MIATPTRVVVYGDLETVTTYRERVEMLSNRDNFEVMGWFHDPEGLRTIAEPSDASGLVGALGECVLTQAALHIPFPFDAPGAQRWLLIAHWLRTWGLRLLISGKVYVWDAPTDAVDLAVRRTLDSASSLAAAVVARGAVPALDDLLVELLGKEGDHPSCWDDWNSASWGEVAKRADETEPTDDSPLALFSDAGLLASLEDLSELDWARFHQLVVELDAEDPKAWVVDQSWTDGDGIEHSSRHCESPKALWRVIEFLKDNDLIVNSPLGDWMLLGRCPLDDRRNAIDSIRQGSAQDALRLMTALARADRLRGGLLCGSLESGLLMAVLEKVLSWWPTRRENAFGGEKNP